MIQWIVASADYGAKLPWVDSSYGRGQPESIEESRAWAFVPYLPMLIRAAAAADAMAVARVHVRSWQAAYRNLLPDEYLDQLRPEDRAQRYDFATADRAKPQTMVALEDGLIRGFATTMPSRDSDLPDYGELCALYVDPECWGHGLGKALVSAASEQLAAQGFENALLWVLAGNVRADRFYRGDQWTPDGAQRTDTVWGVKVEEVRYRRKL
jgi:ribosomal protein S18 acetylase RimI-like enzyme